MVLLPGCKCCGPCWKCYSDGTDFECVGPEDTAPDGWLPVGKCHATEDKCKESCGPCWKCYGKYDLPDDDCGLGRTCFCDGVKVEIADSFVGKLTYDKLVYLPDKSDLPPPDSGELEDLLDRAKLGMNYMRSNLLASSENGNSGLYKDINPPTLNFPNTPCYDTGTIPPIPFRPENALSGLSSCADQCGIMYRGLGITVPGAGMVAQASSMAGFVGAAYVQWLCALPIGEDFLRFNFCPEKESLILEVSGREAATYTACRPLSGGQYRWESAVFSLTNAKFTFTIPLIYGEDKTGTCCLPNGSCSVTTHSECADKCGLWTPDATCEDEPCEIVKAKEYQCFDAQPTEDGWLAIGDCHDTENECAKECGPWVCYQKLNMAVCSLYGIAATIKVVSVTNTHSSYAIDTSPETGLPPGAVFDLLRIRDNGGVCRFTFDYRSPTSTDCQSGGFAGTGLLVYANISRSATNITIDGPSTGGQIITMETGPRCGKGLLGTTQLSGFGKNQFTGRVVDIESPTVEYGIITYEINVIDLSVDDPDIPEDKYEYQCFAAEPPMKTVGMLLV